MTADNVHPLGLHDDGLPDVEWCAEIPPGAYQLSVATNPIGLPLRSQPFTLNWSFKLAKYPISQAQFRSFMQDHTVTKETPECINRDKDPTFPRGSVWWFDTFTFARWLTKKYRAAGLLDENWMIDLPSEAEWELAALYPNRKPWRPSRERYTHEAGSRVCEINPDTGMHIALGYFREWCWRLSWHNRASLGAALDRLPREGRSYANVNDIMVQRGIAPTFRVPLSPTNDSGVGFRVVCRPNTTA